jgi:hypothetical protein
MRAGPVVVSLVLVAAMGVVHGIYTDRWGQSRQLQDALAGLSRVPVRIGDWEGIDRTLEPEVIKAAGIDGAVYRSYSNPKTPQGVSVLLVCGRGGPITVHTPDICYEGAGYRQLGPEKSKVVETGEHSDSFYVARFGKPDVVPTELEIYWAWSLDGQSWQAPESPRRSLARARALYKLYVVREFPRGSRESSEETSQEFLKEVLPEIRAALSPATK